MGWLQTDRISMQSMLDLEYRLRVHLHVLSRCINSNDPEPEQAAETFIYLAARFSSRETELETEAAVLACKWLSEDGPRAHGARDALLLFPSPTVYAQMQQTYVTVESLRPVLIYILTQHGARLPKGLTNQAELQNQDPFLQAQTLYYAANDTHSDMSTFNEYYASLMNNPDSYTPEHGTMVAAIWGGLVRDDSDAKTALQRAIERETDDIQRLDFLRLAAMLGNPDYFPILLPVVEKIPEVGYHFMALHGQTESAAVILEGLMHPRTAKYAEQAWWWVSGQILPRKPRLSVVGENNEDQELEEEVGYVPDQQAAEKWWNRHANGKSLRWLQGQPFSSVIVSKLLSQYTGLISNDIFDLFALATHVPLQLGNYTWHETRLRKISQLGQQAKIVTNSSSRPDSAGLDHGVRSA
jgi:hypothetical protein